MKAVEGRLTFQNPGGGSPAVLAGRGYLVSCRRVSVSWRLRILAFFSFRTRTNREYSSASRTSLPPAYRFSLVEVEARTHTHTHTECVFTGSGGSVFTGSGGSVLFVLVVLCYLFWWFCLLCRDALLFSSQSSVLLLQVLVVVLQRVPPLQTVDQ